LKAKFLIAVIAILLAAQFSGCGLLKENFDIVLADTGETMLTEKHIAAYHSDGTIDLNQNGIEKWNSYHTYPGIPKLGETLYQKEFIIKIDGKEICRGKFWSAVSSQTVEGIVILESLFKLDKDHQSIRIQSAYPWNKPLDASISSELDRFFGERELLK
jgi:hypothetical protein